MIHLSQRIPALVMTLVMVAGNAAVCAGWAATPQARMACCADSGHCPMHTGDSHPSGSEHAFTQAQADACCASSEHPGSTQSGSPFAVAASSAVLGTGVVLPVAVPHLVLSDNWRTAAPVPVAPIPKHVLLSVFLV